MLQVLTSLGDLMEARVGIEPTYKGFADLSLTTWVPRLGHTVYRNRLVLSAGKVAGVSLGSIDVEIQMRSVFAALPMAEMKCAVTVRLRTAGSKGKSRSGAIQR